MNVKKASLRCVGKKQKLLLNCIKELDNKLQYAYSIRKRPWFVVCKQNTLIWGLNP